MISQQLPSRLMMSQFARLIISHHQQVGKLAHAVLQLVSKVNSQPKS